MAITTLAELNAAGKRFWQPRATSVKDTLSIAEQYKLSQLSTQLLTIKKELRDRPANSPMAKAFQEKALQLEQEIQRLKQKE